MQRRLPFRAVFSLPMTGLGTCVATMTLCTLLCSIALAPSAGALMGPLPQASSASSQTTRDQPASLGSAAPQAAPQAPSASEDREKDTPEMSTQESEPTFRVKVNLVEVRVVVRDAQGHTVGGLKKEDFQLLDNGKPQVITKFSVEQPGPKPVTQHAGEIPENPDQQPTVSTAPERYIAYVFDDVHLQFDSLAQARTAAGHYLESLSATDRVAIYTTSGRGEIDFTDDRARLHDALNGVIPHPVSGSGTSECPHMSYYMADMIQNHQDTQALEAATQDAVDCAFAGVAKGNGAEHMARNAATMELHLGEHETQISLDTLKRVVRRIAAMPGQRTVVLVSPGFLNPEQHQEESAIAQQALHSGIVINTLDARGLYTVGDDASKRVPPRHLNAIFANVDSTYSQYAVREKTADADILQGLADATGGTFFHNNNDLNAGFRRLAAAPEYSYLLAFSPQNLKLDGQFHALKVVIEGQKFNIQARKGYYAPKQAAGPEEQSSREIEEAVFSREEYEKIPVQLHTEFFKSSEQDAKLSVLIRLDARRLRFRKLEGRNRNDVTIVSALFDRNGKFLSGNEKTLQMRLKDETLHSKLISGVTLKTSFDVRPGSYLVRLVVRDDEGVVAAQNGAVEIP